MKTDSLTDDARRHEKTIHLLHDGEYPGDDDGENPPCSGRMHEPTAALHGGDDHGRNPAQQDADVGNDAEETEAEADEDAEVQARGGEECAGDDAIDEAYDELTAEEGDEVAVDLREAVHDLVLKLTGTQRDVVAPLLRDLGRLGEEVKEVERNDDQRQQEAEETKESAKTAAEKIPDRSEDFRQGVVEPLAAAEIAEDLLGV